jgi:long-chain acyl-CoA synthetase
MLSSAEPQVHVRGPAGATMDPNATSREDGGIPCERAGALVPDLLTCSERRYPDQIAVDAAGHTLTFAELSTRASQLAAMLHATGVSGGRRVGLLAMNDPEYLEIRVGAQRAGAILVPLNYRLAPAELAAIVQDADIDLLIVGRELEDIAAAQPVARQLLLGDGSYARAIAAHDPLPVPAGYRPEDVREICYTSGTTARPKGAMLSNRAVHASTIAMGHEMAARAGNVFLVSGPLFHVGSHVALAFTFLGGTVVQLPRFDVGAWLDAHDRTAPTHAHLVPTMLQMLLDAWDGNRRSTLERVMYGGAPMPEALLPHVLDTFGCELVNGYGSTEAMGISFLIPEEHTPDHLRSVGRSSTITRSRLLDDAGRDAAPGEVGEVVARGPSLMSGYWRNPKATRAALVDGWMHTGDLGFRDDDGYLHLVDRRSDRIVTGGENVFPSEVEGVLATHPSVGEAAVVGAEHPLWGEAVVAVVVPAPGASVDAPALERHCRDALAGYKVPKRIVVRAEPLPRTSTGKVLRRELRREL